MKYSKDGVVAFDEKTHTYWNGEKKLESISSFVNRHKNKFDAETIATAFAKKNGLNKDDVLAMWKREGELSCEYGTAVHMVFETYIKTGEIILTGKYEKEAIAAKFINDYFISGRLTPVESEIILYNDTNAGQADCIAEGGRGEYFILDWKTNKAISYNGYGKYMLHPFNDLKDCNFYHYSLQLSMYKNMCKDYKIKECFIIHLDNEKYNIIPIATIN